MFERYSEPARRVIFFSRYEASEFGSSTIETEHLLMGVLREDDTLARQAMGTTNDEIRNKIKERVRVRPKTSTAMDLPLTTECKRILACADEEAQSGNATTIEPAHILLGILREESCVAAKVLTEMGAGLVPLREHFAKAGVKSPRSTSIHGLIAEVPEDRHDILRELIIWMTTVDRDELEKRIHDLLRRRN